MTVNDTSWVSTSPVGNDAVTVTVTVYDVVELTTGAEHGFVACCGKQQGYGG